MKLYNEDCLKGMKRLDDESIDLVVTSPPYDNLRTYNGFSFDFKGTAKELYRVVKQGGVVVWIVSDSTVNGSETGTSFKQALFFKEIGFNLHDTMIWRKISPFTHKNRYIADFEYMFVFSKGKPKTTNIICDRKNKWGGTPVHGTLQQKNDGKLAEINGKGKRKVKEYGARYNVWDIPPEKNNRTGHPAVFPRAIAKDHILSWSNKGDTVLDPFSGSGTTAIEAINNGREFIGFEISKEYYDKSLQRINDETAQMNLFSLAGSEGK